MASNITLKAVGLNISPNQLDLPPGSLVTASNVIIKRDNVVEPRRGYPLYGNALGTSSDRAKQLMTYKERILRHFSDTLEYDSDGNGTFLPFCGNYLEPQTGRRIRYIESNGNFYFTTADGIKKIAAKTAADFTTACPYITQAGGIKALDLSSRLNIVLGNESGFLPQDSAVAYRQVWGETDINNNLILGTPSQRSVIFNPLINLEIGDFNRLLNALDEVSDELPASLISDGDYVSTLSLPITASADELRTNLISLTAKLDADILYADQVAVAPLQIAGASINGSVGTINFSSGNPSNYFSAASKIILSGFTPNSGVLNGPQIISTLVPAFTTTGTTTTGVFQTTNVTTVADTTNSLAGTYFTINNANDITKYYVWYNVSGNGIDPAISDSTPIRVNINTNDTANTVATNTAAAILAQASVDFTTSVAGNVVTITNTLEGPSTNAFAGTSGFTVTVTSTGVSGNVITAIGSIAGINVGSFVNGTGIAPNTYVTEVGVSTITISSDVSSNNVGETLTFDPGINFNLTSTPTPTGPVNTLNATIISGEYEFIAQPASPDSPPTDAELVAIQDYLQAIITQLQSEPDTGTPPTISASSQTDFISVLQLTTTATVILKFTIPAGVTTSNFYQIYRSDIAQATGTQVLATDIVPNDELKLVFEGFPTAQDLINGYIQVEDITPDAFRGAFLYTDETNGEGILQSNDLPPFALDINKFKNVVFYANTRTRHRETINLLGVINMINDFNMGTIPTITISDGTITNTYTFVTGVQEKISVTTVADIAGNLAGKYFTFNNANDNTMYYIWYNVSGTGTDPAIAGKSGIEVFLNTGDSANEVALKTNNALSLYVQDFTTSLAANIITITNTEQGSTTAPTAGTSGFAVAVITAGRGENAAAKQILLSTVVSPAQAVDQTARSIVHVINSNPNESVYAYYLSGSNQVPGQILLESRTLNNNPFYIVGNNANTGASFNPDISPTVFISSISVANPTVVTTSTPHGLINQNKVVITNSNSIPSIDGLHQITYISTTQFSLPINVTVAGTRGALINAAQAVTSDNEVLPNRIYYSKVLQPEAVPLLNTIDVGAKDKAILRIFPLRDSLFVYKEDGLFRISGEVSPFNLALFDSSCVLLAPDSVDVSNNLIYGWTTQGIVTTSESGVNIISRPIDTEILKLATTQYTNFKTATWGIGYESDNSYTTYTIKETNDIYATIGYRYSTLTNTWTTFDKTDTCGVINSFNDTQYLGAGDINFLEKERKDFTRYDYADREYVKDLILNNYYGNQLQLPDITNISAGDVLVQDQQMTVFQFNTLLGKLDVDPSLSPHDYVATRTIGAGLNQRTQLDLLLNKIANDPGRTSQGGAFPGSDYTAYESITSSGTITAISSGDPTVITTSAAHNLQTGRVITITGSNSTPSINGTFKVDVISSNTFTIPVSVIVAGTSGSFTVNNDDVSDVAASYNGMIVLLNNDPGLSYSNYMKIINDTSQEAIIVNVNPLNKRITLNNTLDFFVGPLTVFKAIDSTIQWGPQTFGDALGLKHVREATLMFENKAFTSGILSFSSDLLPAFIDIPFGALGNGIFGYTGNPGTVSGTPGKVGFGYNFFGGAGNSAPFRTYIPRDVQRCRYLNCKFTNHVAREKYSLFGMTLTSEVAQSSRAYR